MVPGGGIEPPTRGFSIHCSTPELPGQIIDTNNDFRIALVARHFDWVMRNQQGVKRVLTTCLQSVNISSGFFVSKMNSGQRMGAFSLSSSHDAGITRSDKVLKHVNPMG